jgi:hypothetical protein
VYHGPEKFLEHIAFLTPRGIGSASATRKYHVPLSPVFFMIAIRKMSLRAGGKNSVGRKANETYLHVYDLYDNEK